MFSGTFKKEKVKYASIFYVHISFKNYVISKGDPLPPCHLPVIRLGYPRPPIFYDVIFAQPP